MTEWNRFPMQGVEVYKNPKNKFVIFQLHYSADPKKRDAAYRDAVKSGMPVKQYMQEYELQWESFAGNPVYADFNRKIHGSETRIWPELGLPLLRGWDFGLTPACVVAQIVGNQIRILKEWVTINEGIDTFSQKVLMECNVLWPEWGDRKRDWRDFMDPAGTQRKDTDTGTCAKILSDREPKGRGLTLTPGPVAWLPRREAVEYFLTHQDKDGPYLRVAMADCPILVRGFEGGYRYPEKTFDSEPDKIRPLKDEHSHPHDALQYLCAGIRKVIHQTRIKVASPNYGFQSKGPDMNAGLNARAIK